MNHKTEVIHKKVGRLQMRIAPACGRQGMRDS